MSQASVPRRRTLDDEGEADSPVQQQNSADTIAHEPPPPLGFSRSLSNAGFFEWRGTTAPLPKRLFYLTQAKPRPDFAAAACDLRSFTPTNKAWQGGRYGGSWSW